MLSCQYIPDMIINKRDTIGSLSILRTAPETNVVTRVYISHDLLTIKCTTSQCFRRLVPSLQKSICYFDSCNDCYQSCNCGIEIVTCGSQLWQYNTHEVQGYGLLHEHKHHNWRAEKQSGLTQNHVLEIAWIAQICNKNMHTLPVYALNFEIRKFSAAPETHFKSIFMFSGGGGKVNICGLDYFASEPFNYS